MHMHPLNDHYKGEPAYWVSDTRKPSRWSCNVRATQDRHEPEHEPQTPPRGRWAVAIIGGMVGAVIGLVAAVAVVAAVLT